LVELREYQKYAIKKFKEHDKILLLWYRQSGKTQVISEIISNFVSKNSNKKIIFFVFSIRYSIITIERLKMDIPTKIVKVRKTDKKIEFINNNVVEFHSLLQSDINSIFKIQPSLVFFDIIFKSTKIEVKNLNIVKTKMNSINKCKWIIISSTIYPNDGFFNVIDCDDVFYVNAMSYNMNFNSKTPVGYEWLEFEYNYDAELIYLFSYKRKSMVEVMNKSHSRKMKLEKLNKNKNDR